MTNALIAPEYELFPNRYRWTVQECHDMAASGQLVGRYEILDGEVVSKMGQKPAHAMTLTQLLEVMSRIFGPAFLRIQSPITLQAPDSVYTEPEPDIAVTCGPAADYAARHPGPEDLTLVIEVSDTTIRTDLIVKSRVYARAGIPEYWIVDLSTRQVHIHRNPTDESYRLISVHEETDTIAAATRPGDPIRVGDLLPPPSI